MSTMHRRLYRGGLYKRRPAICLPLTSRHTRNRLQWNDKCPLDADQWRVVLFTDESTFNLEGDSRRYLIRRESGTRYNPSNIRERDAYGRGSVCTWGNISWVDAQTSMSFQGEP